MRSRNLSEVPALPARSAANANSIFWASVSGAEPPSFESRSSAILSRMPPKASQEPSNGRISGKYSSSLMSRKARSPSEGLPGLRSHFLNSSNRRSTLRSSSESVRQSSTVSGASVHSKRLANCTPRNMRRESSANAGPTWRSVCVFRSPMPLYGSQSVSSGSSMPIALMVKSRRRAASLKLSFSSVCTTNPRCP